MKIVIENCRYAPTWASLEKVLKEALGDPDGHITRIARVDNGCDYRATGVYKLSWDPRSILGGQFAVSLPITLVCAKVGESI